MQYSDLPVVISLEIHTCHEQQQVMVDIMRETWREYLLQPLTDHDHASIVLPSPAELRRKLLIKVKYTAPQTAKKRLTMKEADLHKTNTRTSSDTEAEDQNPTKVKKSKILSSLSDMGIYTRAYSFKGFDKPEARMPTHVFSLSENTLTDAQEDYSLHTKILEHNKVCPDILSCRLQALIQSTEIHDACLPKSPPFDVHQPQPITLLATRRPNGCAQLARLRQRHDD